MSSRILAPDLDVLAPVRVWGSPAPTASSSPRKWDIPISATEGEAVLDRREHVGPRDRVRRAREPVVVAARGAVHADAQRRATRPREPREIVIGVRAGRAGVARRRADRPRRARSTSSARSVGAYGWGRIDMVENRRVGIKSREVYECPASLALILAHQDLEGITLERDVAREKQRVEIRVAELIYDGLWHSPLMRALDAFVDETQEHVTGEVRLRLEAGPVRRGRPARAARSLRPRPRDLRRRGRVPPRGLRRASCGSGASRRETWSRRQGPGAA